MKAFMVIWRDGDHIHRALGQHENEEQADALALAQLKEYRRKRPELTGWNCVVKEINYDTDGNPQVLSEKERA